MKKKKKARNVPPAREEEALDEQAALAAIYGADFTLAPDGSAFSVTVRAASGGESAGEEDAEDRLPSVALVRAYISNKSEGARVGCADSSIALGSVSHTASATRVARRTCALTRCAV